MNFPFPVETGRSIDEQSQDIWQPSNSANLENELTGAPSPLAMPELPMEDVSAESGSSNGGGFSKEELRSLIRPKLGFSSQWQSLSDVNLSNFDVRVTIPTYPFFGPPPPMISVGFSYTDLVAPDSYGLPSDLYAYSIGLSWIRPVRDRWMIRSMLGVALATDNVNTTSDAWQFRGGVFAVYEPCEQWQWVFGAIAVGRNDLPVVPAVGAVWKPRRDLTIDFTFPKPKIAKLIAENESRQQWGYLSIALDGGTWAYERFDRVDDQLTYRDWRVLAGWESLPAPVAGKKFSPGRRLGVELGYVFARELQFESDSPDLPLDDALMLGFTGRF